MLKAWWPQNEAATAALLAYDFSGDELFLDWFRKIDAYSWKHLRDPDFPEWFAYAAVDGRQVHSYKGSRWKTFFHLPRCLLNCSE
ncbi:N-acylglucosamine 2-epimerase, partial [Candidatus Falkowbacteria bacterium]|nr:N-acylglucosamine 2-epimerase [Candidatus Falkowbacteria bacterium]